MEGEKARANTLDYPTLVDLARSRNIRCLEVRGLDTGDINNEDYIFIFRGREGLS